MPSPTYVQGATGMQKGVKHAETGLAIESIDWTINDPVEYSQDRYGGNNGFVHGFNPSVDVANTGGFYPTAISFSESRDGFRSMSITTISHPAIT